MNQNEIEWASRQNHQCPNVRKGVMLLARLVHSVNDQSDGWAYWTAPLNASKKLINLLKSTGNLNYGTHGTISDSQLQAAVSPIRRMVTVQSEKQKKYGNTFAFDVDAALLEFAVV